MEHWADDAINRTLASDREYVKARNDYEEMLAGLIERSPSPRKEQITALKQMLDTKTDWLSAPASCRYHLCKPGGLLLHSMNVGRLALTLAKEMMGEDWVNSAILAGVFHDVGKVGSVLGKVVPRYLPKVIKTGEKSGQLGYTYNKELLSVPIAVNSLRILSKYVDLIDEEAQAILGHDGQYIEENKSLAHNECPLLVLVHFADYWSGHVLESVESNYRVC